MAILPRQLSVSCTEVTAPERILAEASASVSALRAASGRPCVAASAPNRDSATPARPLGTIAANSRRVRCIESSSLLRRIAVDVALVRCLSFRNSARYVDSHRVTGPLSDQLLLAEVPENRFLGHFLAPEFHQLCVWLNAAVDWHADLPRPREHLRVVECRFVPERVATDRRISFDDTERIAVEIADAIEPRLRGEARDVHNQRIAIPF